MTVLTRESALALLGDGATDIVIPENFTEIENGAFSFAALTSVFIPKASHE